LVEAIERPDPHILMIKDDLQPSTDDAEPKFGQSQHAVNNCGAPCQAETWPLSRLDRILFKCAQIA
jgi:hypothetical protein